MKKLPNTEAIKKPNTQLHPNHLNQQAGQNRQNSNLFLLSNVHRNNKTLLELTLT